MTQRGNTGFFPTSEICASAVVFYTDFRTALMKFAKTQCHTCLHDAER